MEIDKILKFMLSPTDEKGAIIKCICLYSFLNYLKETKPLQYILLETYVNENFKGIPLSVCLGIQNIYQYIFSSMFRMDINTLNQANQLFNWSQQFKK